MTAPRRPPARRSRRISLLTAIVALGCAALAAQAVAAPPARALDPSPTTLTLAAAPSTVSYGGTAVLSGRLAGAEAGVAGAAVTVTASTDGAVWIEVSAVTTDADGAFSLEVTPAAAMGRTEFLVDFPGNEAFAAVSARLSVGSYASLSAPAAPLCVGRGSSFRTQGDLLPQHPAGAGAVRILAYRREAGAWVLRATFDATLGDAAGGSAYTATVRLTLSGTWRLRAAHADDAHEETYSPWSRSFTVGASADAPIWNRDGVTTWPERMASRRNARQLVLATASRLGARTGMLRLYEYRDGDWVRVHTAAVRYGRRGLTDGLRRRAGSLTTPTGIWRLPAYAFGTRAAGPAGMSLAWRRITNRSWWSSEHNSTYNTWVETSRRVYGEHLADYPVQYEYAVSTGYNARPNPQVYGRGAGIFLHVHGSGYTAGCISLTRADMIRLLAWLEPDRRPACAVGTTLTGTSTWFGAY